MVADGYLQRRWFKRFGKRDAARIRLLCFHCAGGNAAMFRDWPALLPPYIDLIAVQLPGRLDRFSEPPYQAMEPLVDKIAEVMQPFLAEPYACYGASMGGRVAWTLAHVLRERALPPPRALYVAASLAPSAERPGREWERPASGLLDYLGELGGTPPEILADAELTGRLLAVLRADLAVLGTHSFQPVSPLDIPIRAFSGSEDTGAPLELMKGWQQETSAEFRLNVVPGGHFFSPVGRQRVIQVISDDLDAVEGASRDRLPV